MIKLNQLKPKIRLYSTQLRVMNLVVASLRKSSISVKVFMLPSRTKRFQMRRNYHGEGYATYDNYKTKIHRALVVLSDIKQLSKVINLVNRDKVLLEARIT